MTPSKNIVIDSSIPIGPQTKNISSTKFLFGGNQSERIKLLKEQKLPNENVYLVNIPHEDIDSYVIRATENHVNNFFTNNSYENNFQYNKHFGFSKGCWLTSEFVKDGKFRSYIGGHFNPRTKTVIVHPGAQRYRILRLFGENEPILFWNTNEVKYSWMKDSQIIPLDKDHEIFKKYEFGLVADHGSLIPHFILKKDGPMDDSTIKYFNYVQNICKSIKIKTNIEYNVLKKFVYNNGNHNSEIIFKNDDKSSLYKGLFLLFSGSSYEDEDVMVKVNI